MQCLGAVRAVITVVSLLESMRDILQLLLNVTIVIALTRGSPHLLIMVRQAGHVLLVTMVYKQQVRI